MSVEMDPLSTYEAYPSYEGYNPAPVPMPNYHNLTYPQYDVKVEHPMINQEFFNHFLNNVTENNGEEKVLTNLNETSKSNEHQTNIVQDIKPEFSLDIQKNIKKEKKTGKRSNYWSVKITDNDFKFYGCAICNISYPSLLELDQHVTIHKDRITSYDLKIKNLIRRKKLKKEQKKLKKLSKIKKENDDQSLEIPEIKPEDGYIGNEKASEYNEDGTIKNNGNVPTNSGVNPENGKQSDCKENKDGNASNGGNSNNDNGNENNGATDKQLLTNLEKIYKCFACQKQFTLSYYLKLHVRSHTGMYLFI